VRRITVVGSKKMIVFNDMEVEQKLKIYDKGVDTPEYTDSFGEFHCNYRSGDILIPKVRIAEPLRQECQHFVDSIINKTRPDSDGYSGLKVVKIIEAAESSLKNHSTKETFAWEPLNMPALRQM
jgi:predicted dehydrogenase